MKQLIPIAAAALLTGCPTYDEMLRVVDYSSMGQSGNVRISQPYNRDAYEDGYQRGREAGYRDAGRGRAYGAKVKTSGSRESAFSDGYYKGYEAGFYGAGTRSGWNLR